MRMTDFDKYFSSLYVLGKYLKSKYLKSEIRIKNMLIGGKNSYYNA